MQGWLLKPTVEFVLKCLCAIWNLLWKLWNVADLGWFCMKNFCILLVCSCTQEQKKSPCWYHEMVSSLYMKCSIERGIMSCLSQFSLPHFHLRHTLSFWVYSVRFFWNNFEHTKLLIDTHCATESHTNPVWAHNGVSHFAQSDKPHDWQAQSRAWLWAVHRSHPSHNPLRQCNIYWSWRQDPATNEKSSIFDLNKNVQ